LNPIGPFGVSVDANAGIAFDILSDPLDADATIGGDHGYAALTRNATSGGAYLLYNVDLATGTISGGALVGGGLDFTGGLAMTYGVPEPATLLMAVACAVVLFGGRRGK
jgi:hypothetical protein